MSSSKLQNIIFPGIYVLPRPALSFIKGLCLYLIIAEFYFYWFMFRIMYHIGLILDKTTIIGFNLATKCLVFQWLYHMFWLATSIIAATFYSKRSSYSEGKIYGIHKKLLDNKLIFFIYFGFIIFLLPVLVVVIISLFDWPNFFTSGLLDANGQFHPEPVVSLYGHILLLFWLLLFYLIAICQISDDGPGVLRSLIILIRCHIWGISLEDQSIYDR